MEQLNLFFLLITITTIFFVNDVCGESSTHSLKTDEISKPDLSTLTVSANSTSLAITDFVVKHQNTSASSESLILPRRKVKKHRRNKHKRLGHNHHKRKSHSSHRFRNKKDSKKKDTQEEHDPATAIESLKVSNSTEHVSQAQTTEIGKNGSSGRRKYKRHHHHHHHNLHKTLHNRRKRLRTLKKTVAETREPQTTSN